MKQCDLCDRAAMMYCESDQASLCWECDTKVHGANFLVARHSRSLLCRSCQTPTPWRAEGARLGRTVSVCERCVVEGNKDNDGVVGGRRRDGEEVGGDGRGRRGDGSGEDDVEGNDEDGDDEEEDEEVEEEEDGENQVVPWSLTPPPVPSSSSSDEEEEEEQVRRGNGGGALKRMRGYADLAGSQDTLSCTSSVPAPALPAWAVSEDDDASAFSGDSCPCRLPKRSAFPRPPSAHLNAANLGTAAVLSVRARVDRRAVDLGSSSLNRPS